jgi:hypothetical protein
MAESEQAAISELPVAHSERHGQGSMSLRVVGVQLDGLPQEREPGIVVA